MRTMMMLVLLCAIICIHPFMAVAGQTQELDEVVITATRSETGLEHVGGASLSVITAAQIEELQLQSLGDALRNVPGVQISDTGGMGATRRVFIRGAESKNTLLLIDGIVANDPSDTNRGADLANISLDNIERIEVIRGPMSVLYGSNATAGVINVITKSGARGLRGYVAGEAGTFNTQKGSMGLRGGNETVTFALGASHLESDGYSLANADNNSIPHAGNTSEDDGWRNTSVNGNVRVNLTQTANIRASVYYTEASMDLDDWNMSGYAGDRFDYDPSLWAYTPAPDGLKKQHDESERLFGKLELMNVLFDGRLESVLGYKYANQERDSYNADGAPSYDYSGRTDEWSWQGKLELDAHNELSAGIGYLDEEIESSTTSSEDAGTLSCWLQHQFFKGGFDIVSGVRYDEHEEFGGKVTWRVAPAYSIAASGTTLRAVYATGFRTPSLYELYSEYGNVDLDPEESESWEVGLEQAFLDGRLKCGITYFRMEFEDRIGWDGSRVIPGAAWPGGYAQMEGESNTSGVETFATWTAAEHLDVSVDYVYIDTEDVDGTRMVRRPLNKVHAGLGYRPVTGLSINVDLHWIDERNTLVSAADINGNSVKLDDYFLVNLAAHYDFNDFVRIYARVHNLFDEHYEEAWSYAVPGQSFYAGVRLNF